MDFTLTTTCVAYDTDADQYACIRPTSEAANYPHALDLAACMAALLLADGQSIPAEIGAPIEFLGVNWWPITWDPIVSISDSPITGARVVADLTKADGTTTKLESLPLAFDADALYHRTFPAIAVDNATERLASPEMGGGLYDCDSRMGEGYSHGIFVAGFSWMLLSRHLQIAPDVRECMIDLMKVMVEYIFRLRLDTGAFRQQVESRPGQKDLGLLDTTEPTYGLFCAAEALAAPSLGEPDPELAGRCREAVVSAVRWLAEHVPKGDGEGDEHFRLDIAALLMHAYSVTSGREFLELCERLVIDEFLEAPERLFPNTRWGSMPRVELFLRLLEAPISGASKTTIDAYLCGELLNHYVSRAAEPVFPMPLPEKIMLGGPEHSYRVANSHMAANAAEALLLHQYTIDTRLRRVADGYLQWIAGLNYGFPAGMTDPAGDVDGLCASMIKNVGKRQAVSWDGFTPIIPARTTPIWTAPTIINGLGARLQFENIWQHGETFIKHDGFWLMALSLWNPDAPAVFRA